MRRWTPRRSRPRPLSTQYMGAKRSSSIRGSASFRKTSAQLLSRRLAFFGVTRNWDCQRKGLVFGTSSPPSARRSAHDLLLHYPHLAPGWRGVFTNKSRLPLFLFGILFGLSMDYHMLLLNRIKESHDKGFSNEEAVSEGIKLTAGQITAQQLSWSVSSVRSRWGA